MHRPLFRRSHPSDPPLAPAPGAAGLHRSRGHALRALNGAAQVALNWAVQVALGVSVGTAALVGLPAWAQNTVGDVVRIDKAQGKLTLKHGAIASLDVPAMTMAYRVRDPQWLDQLKPGDRVRFDADRINGQFTVTRLSIGP